MRVVGFLFLVVLASCGAKPDAAGAQTLAGATHAISIDHAWAGVMPGGTDVGAGYLTVSNAGVADKLISASSPRAQMVMLHDMHMEGSMMVMRTAEGGMDVPAHGALTFSPGGAHLMFMGVTQPFAAGEQIPVTLTFEHAGAVTLNLPVNAGGR
ncbi:MAG: copper chaperone PCu(A)C [Terricaulis sp.]